MARAFGEQLPWSELRKVVPLGLDPLDSAAMAQAYVHKWLKQQVVLQQAERNLGADQKDFEARLRDYRNSLVIFAYEQALVDQKLDAGVDDAEIEEYYENNRANFELRDNILRLRWFRVREPDKRVFKKLEGHFMSGDAERMREVELWLAQRNIPIMDRSQSWTAFSELRNEIPVWATADPDVRLNEGRTILRDKEGGYFIDILELRRKNSVSPLALVEQDIRSILINQRKLRLIERMREDIYQDAQANGHVEIY